MPFAGEEMLTTEPRWDYLLHYFGLKLPLPVLLLVVAGVVLMVMALRRPDGLDGISRAKRNVVLVIGAAILAPPAYAIVVRSVVYDGLRHFLFLVPPLIVMAAVTAVVLPRAITRSRNIVVSVLALALTGMLGRQIHAMVQLHPYQYIYFNELIGGMPGAAGNYDTDYYGASYKEGFRALTEHLWEVDREHFLDRRYTVAGCIPGLVARNYIEGGLVWVDSVADDPRFYLGYTRSDCHERHGMRPEFHRVERMDTLLLMIRDLHEGRGKLPPALRPRPSSPPDAAP